MPPKAEITYLRPALDDMEEIVKFHINEVGPASARKIYADMRHTLGLLADFPLMGQTRIIDGVVTIYRVVNGRTDYPRLLK